MNAIPHFVHSIHSTVVSSDLSSSCRQIPHIVTVNAKGDFFCVDLFFLVKLKLNCLSLLALGQMDFTLGKLSVLEFLDN